MVSSRKIKILHVVGDWVEDYEAMIPIQAMQMLGIEVHVVSPGKEKGQMVLSCVHDFDRTDIDGATDILFQNALGVSKKRNHMQYQAVSERIGHGILLTQDFDKVNVDEYNGIFCPGGRSPEFLQLDDTVLGWVQRLFKVGKPVAAICHGVQIIAAAGIVKGKRCTGHPCCKPQTVASGAIWEPTNLIDTVIDGNLLTVAEWTGISNLLADFANALGVHWTYGAGLDGNTNGESTEHLNGKLNGSSLNGIDSGN